MPRDAAFSCPEDIMQFIAGELGEGGRMISIRLFCHDARPDQVVCIMGMPVDVRSRAMDNGNPYAAGSNLTKVFSLSAAFRCPNRLDGNLHVHSCDACHAVLDGARVVMDTDPLRRTL